MLRFILLILLCLGLGQARTITDMAGRQVDVEANLTKVFGSSPPTTYLVALYKPEALVGLNFPLDNANNRGSAILDPYLKTLPILKGWHGNAGGSSAEKLLERGTQAIIGWDNPFLNGMIEKTLRGTEIPVIYIEPDDPRKLPGTFRFLSMLFDLPRRGEELAAYAEAANARLAAVRSRVQKPKRVYYAMGPKGLQSECDNSFHATFIEEAGAVNVNRCRQSSLIGMESVDFEALLADQPDAIVVQDPGFFRTVFDDKRWKMLKAVKAGAVYYVPKTPINWLDRPPSFMRLIGAQWLASKLYPEAYGADISEETKRFFALFFHRTLDDKTLEAMMQP
jgi:iron complex transport system substrate-binding protein